MIYLLLMIGEDKFSVFSFQCSARDELLVIEEEAFQANPMTYALAV
jgi:hypothetical protein